MSKQTDLINVTDAITVDSSNNVGIGTSSPTGGNSVLTIKNVNGTGAQINFRNAAATDGYIGLSGDANGDLIHYLGATADQIFYTSGSEAMRLDSSGNLLVGKTSGPNYNVVGVDITHLGEGQFTVFSNPVLQLNRQTSDGDIAVFRKDGTTVGSISTYNDGIVFGNSFSSSYANLRYTDDQVFPCTSSGGTNDNAIDLGKSNSRFDDIYATNGTIQTSDRNEKQDIEVLSDAEQRVAVACKGLLRKFRWIDSVTEKGDDARIHFGIIAQDLQDAFTAEGLDAGRYAMFISTTWWETQTDVPAVAAVAEVLDDDGNVVTEAVEAKDAYTRTDTYETLEEAPAGATERTRLGVRYPELLAFIIGAM